MHHYAFCLFTLLLGYHKSLYFRPFSVCIYFPPTLLSFLVIYLLTHHIVTNSPRRSYSHLSQLYSLNLSFTNYVLFVLSNCFFFFCRLMIATSLNVPCSCFRDSLSSNILFVLMFILIWSN